MRTRTDVEIPAAWLLFPLASYLVWAILAATWWSTGVGLGIGDIKLVVSGLGILGLGASGAASYVVYALVNRGNRHASRTRSLLRGALDTLESRLGASGSQTLLPLNSSEESLYNLTRRERERSAVLWALLSLIPFIGWIFFVTALWLLSRDLARHARLEELVLEDVDRTLRVGGLQGIPVRYEPVRSHDGLGFGIAFVSVIVLFSWVLLGLAGSLVLIYLTVGAFGLFWVDLAVRDPARHFYYHSQFEADLLRALPDAAAGGVRGG